MQEDLNLGRYQNNLDRNIEGAKPIIISLISKQDLQNISQTGYSLNPENKFGLDDPTEVRWAVRPGAFSPEGFLYGGYASYVISTLDNSNKYSENFDPCIGLVVAGIEKDNNRRLSFMIHSEPQSILFDQKKKFTEDLKKRLEEMHKKCRPGTFDAVIFGGEYDKEVAYNFPLAENEYAEAINLFGENIKKVLGFEPMVYNGPKITKDRKVRTFDDAYYDNENRRLYLVRPTIHPKIGAFLPSEVKAHESKWKNSQ